MYFVIFACAIWYYCISNADSIYEVITAGKGQCVDSNNVGYASFLKYGFTLKATCASWCEEIHVDQKI